MFLSLLLLFFYFTSSPLSIGGGGGAAMLQPPTKIAITDQHHIQSLANGTIGTKMAGISQFKRYLSRFGYYYHDQNNTDDEFDAMFQRALVRYQKSLALQVTGKLDSQTVSQMVTPRCGVPDTLLFTRRFVYFPGKPRWSRDSSRDMPITLTYAFSPDYVIHSLSALEIRGAFRRAFARWASVIPVRFEEAEEFGYAEIKIGFYSGEHGDGEAFDGVLGVLAHSFSPEIGRLHLDAAETWAVDFGKTESEVAVDLESVATHEIGHVLGLSHSTVKEAVMYPSLRPREKRAELNEDDIKGVQSLYGSQDHCCSSLQSYNISANHASHHHHHHYFKFGLKLPYCTTTTTCFIIIMILLS